MMATIATLEIPQAPAFGSVDLIRADTLKPEPIRWLWPGWLARGKLHVLAGAPGTGKTTLAMELAACVSAGRALPSGWRPDRGGVLIWSGEDDPADTLAPRLIAAGADLSRIQFVGEVSEDGQRFPFDPAHDVDKLAASAATIGDVALLIVDPLVSAVAGDSHRNAEVRRGLAPLVDLAAKLDAALLGITHYSKGTAGREPLERVSGSLAFGALARVVLGTVRQEAEGEDAPRRMLLARAKSNIGPTAAVSCTPSSKSLCPIIPASPQAASSGARRSRAARASYWPRRSRTTSTAATRRASCAICWRMGLVRCARYSERRRARAIPAMP